MLSTIVCTGPVKRTYFSEGIRSYLGKDRPAFSCFPMIYFQPSLFVRAYLLNGYIKRNRTRTVNDKNRDSTAVGHIDQYNYIH